LLSSSALAHNAVTALCVDEMDDVELQARIHSATLLQIVKVSSSSLFSA
jgi:hypothetical protein